LLRGHNVNAPVPGLGRPDPTAGNVIEIESTANSSLNMLHVGVNRFSQRFHFSVNYSWAKATNEADSPLSLPANNFDLRAERGPAAFDARHRLFVLTNVSLPWQLRLGAFFTASSATPYNITTGFDDNGDSVSNDRPAGVGRNSARGDGRWDASARLSWSTGFGKPRESATRVGGPRLIRLGGGDSDILGALPSGATNHRYRMEFYAQASNLFNHTNLTNFVGVQTSPFFGQATAALPGRRIETGVKFSF
ncbi:MAG TPA: hypothetical protein VNO70_27335, partial [Blastocatellia bacterium]|nr:hypothetical protein [Blastocatellia bacterium]